MNFEFNEQAGIIKDKVTGERCIIITQSRMQEIFSRLSAIFQSGAGVIISEAYKAAGEHFVDEALDEKKVDSARFLETLVQRFSDAGFGKIEIAEFKPEEAELTFRILNNFFAEIRTEEGNTYCGCVEGFACGMYKQILGKTAAIRKTRCVADGDPYCKCLKSVGICRPTNKRITTRLYLMKPS
jgi:predicted hydrocarbon binding protein